MHEHAQHLKCEEPLPELLKKHALSSANSHWKMGGPSKQNLIIIKKINSSKKINHQKEI